MTNHCIARAKTRFSVPPLSNYEVVDLTRLEDGAEFETWCGEKRRKDKSCPTTFVGLDGALALPTTFAARPLCLTCAKAVHRALDTALTGVSTPVVR